MRSHRPARVLPCSIDSEFIAVNRTKQEP
jgi:hypothetical protein